MTTKSMPPRSKGSRNKVLIKANSTLALARALNRRGPERVRPWLR
jgi:hypothetical protein